MQAIHINEVRAMLDDRDTPVTLHVWKKSGEIMILKDCISLKYDLKTGLRNIKLTGNGQIRKIHDICIFRINDIEVYL